MAQTYLNTGTQAGNFEDLVNFVWRISYEEAPFFNKIGTTKAKSINHEWMTQVVGGGTSNNAQAEGFTPSFAGTDVTVRVRRGNQVQLLAKTFSVSYTQEAVDKAGLGQGSEYDNQKMLKYLELYKDADYALLQSTKVNRAADAGTAGAMDGVAAWIPTSNSKDGGGSILTQDMFNLLTQAIFENSGQKTDIILCAGFQRRMISTWTVNFKQHQSSETTLVDSVEIYRGDWGEQAVMPDLQMPTNQIFAIKSGFLKKAFLRPAFHYEIGQVIDGRKGYVGTEVTLEAENPNSMGKIGNLALSA